LDGTLAYCYHHLHYHHHNHHHLHHLSTSLHFAYSFLESDALQVGRYFRTVCLRHQGKDLGSVSHPITLRLTMTALIASDPVLSPFAVNPAKVAPSLCLALQVAHKPNSGLRTTDFKQTTS